MNKPVSPFKVLIVDDQPLIVEELCEFIEGSGYRCVPCHSSQQAIERFTEDPAIGLVLCDLHMPERDGIELVKALKAMAGQQRAFEAIMLTGRADSDLVQRAVQFGVNNYLVKPFTVQVLKDKIEGVFGMRHADEPRLYARSPRPVGKGIGGKRIDEMIGFRHD